MKVSFMSMSAFLAWNILFIGIIEGLLNTLGNAVLFGSASGNVQKAGPAARCEPRRGSACRWVDSRAARLQLRLSGRRLGLLSCVHTQK